MNDHDSVENNGPSTASTQPTQQDQYNMLREEIMHNIRTLDAVQYAAALGAAVVYTWLIVNRVNVTSKIMWYVPPSLLLFCAAKSWDLNKRIWGISAYLARIEEVAFSDVSRTPGWQQYKKKQKLTLYDRVAAAMTAAVWLATIIGSFFLSWHLSK